MKKLLRVVSGSITVRSTCVCRKCGQVKLSSSVCNVDLMQENVGDINSIVESTASKYFFHPPIGWAVSGRGVFDCDSCMNKEGTTDAK